MPSPQVIRERLAEACLELVRIPSVTGDEDSIANHLERWALGLPGLGRDDVLRRDNGLIIGPGDEHKPRVALVGHLDTVPPDAADGPPFQDGDRIVGRGASDMKGSIAVMQALFEHLDVAALPFAVYLVLYDREEGPYNENGLQPLLDHFELLSQIDLALAMEPTDNTLQLGCLGAIHARLVFTGQAAHSARPWEGDNAIHKAAPLLEALSRRPIQNVQVDGFTFREVMAITQAKGGRARNVIPDSFVLNINYRFAPTGPTDEAVARAVAEISAIAGEATVELTDVAPPGPVPVDNPILEHIQSYASLSVKSKQAWSDVARLAAHGIDAVNFGPGAGAQCHQRGEWISIAAMAEAYDLLARVLSVPLRGV